MNRPDLDLEEASRAVVIDLNQYLRAKGRPRGLNDS